MSSPDVVLANILKLMADKCRFFLAPDEVASFFTGFFSTIKSMIAPLVRGASVVLVETDVISAVGLVPQAAGWRIEETLKQPLRSLYEYYYGREENIDKALKALSYYVLATQGYIREPLENAIARLIYSVASQMLTERRFVNIKYEGKRADAIKVRYVDLVVVRLEGDKYIYLCDADAYSFLEEVS